jgi:hypothetical protein
MNENMIADVWNLFKDFLDKKSIDLVAEKYIDLLADYGIDDTVLKEVKDVDAYLDDAISYYLGDADGAEVDDEDN